VTTCTLYTDYTLSCPVCQGLFHQQDRQGEDPEVEKGRADPEETCHCKISHR